MILGGLLAGTGCQSMPEGPAEKPATVRPIEKVRLGILAVRTRLQATLTSADGIPNSGKLMSLRKGTFKDNLKSTQEAVQALRSDVAGMRERADEYLSRWNAQVIGSNNSTQVHTHADPLGERKLEKYNQLLASLTQARDEAVPVLAELERLEVVSRTMDQDAAAQQQFQADLKPLHEQANRASKHLTDAGVRLDELKAIFREQTR
jgi:hypothetical protein